MKTEPTRAESLAGLRALTRSPEWAEVKKNPPSDELLGYMLMFEEKLADEDAANEPGAMQ